MSERFTAEVTAVEVESAAAGRYTFRGVASTVGNVDRSGRVFLPGAFGTQAIKVPLLFQHDDKLTIGSSVLTPRGDKLLHESSLNPKVAKSAEVQALIEDGDIMSTSISWLGDRYYGWSHLQREQPEVAKHAASVGIPKHENVVYFANAQIVENSVVPIPANDRALIEMRAMVESQLEVAALAQGARQKAGGARHSMADMAHIQTAHDAMAMLGATCPPPPGSDAADADGDETPRPTVNTNGLKGGWANSIKTPTDASLSISREGTQNASLDNPLDVLDRELAELEATVSGRSNSSEETRK